MLISTTHWTTQFHGAVSWFQPASSVGRCCKLANWPSPCKGHCCRIHVGMWVAGRCFSVKLLKSQNYLRSFGSFNLFAVNKDICISLRKLRGRLFTIFTAFSCAYLWQFSTIDALAIDCTGVVVPTEECGLKHFTQCVECLQYLARTVVNSPSAHRK